MENSPVIKKARTISRVVLAFSCAFFLSGRMRGIFPFLDVDIWVKWVKSAIELLEIRKCAVLDEVLEKNNQ